MITINLIPTDKKEEVRLSEIYIVIKNLIVLLLLLTTIVAIILLASKMILQNTFNRIVSEATLTTKYGSIFNVDIKNFNQQLKAVEKIQKRYIPWTDFIVNFVGLVPENVSLNNISLNIEGTKNDKESANEFVISGTARTREKLLEFKANLEGSPMFSSVTVPLENLLKKDDISFNIKAKFNPKNLD